MVPGLNFESYHDDGHLNISRPKYPHKSTNKNKTIIRNNDLSNNTNKNI